MRPSTRPDLPSLAVPQAREQGVGWSVWLNLRPTLPQAPALCPTPLEGLNASVGRPASSRHSLASAAPAR